MIEKVAFDNFLGGMSDEPIEAGQMLLIQNMRCNRQGYLESREGYQKVSSTQLGGNILGVGYFYNTTTANAFFVVCCDDGKIYTATDGAAPAFASAAVGFGTTSKWDWLEATSSSNTSLLIGTQGGYAPQKVTSAGVVSALGGSPPQGYSSLYYKQVLFIDKPGEARMYHSDRNNIESGWSQYVGFAAGNAEQFMSCFISDGVPTVLFAESIHVITGNIAEEFSTKKKLDIGCLFHWSAASDGHWIYFPGSNNNVYRWSYTQGLQNIGKPVESIIRASASLGRGYYCKDRSEYWLTVTDKTPTTFILVCDAQLRWYKFTLPIAAAMNARSVGSGTQMASAKNLFGFTNSKYLYMTANATDDDGAAIVTKVRTPWTFFGAPDALKRVEYINNVGYFTDAATHDYTLNAYYRASPRAAATTIANSITAGSLPKLVRPNWTVEGRQWSSEIVGNEDLTVDGIYIGAEITRYDEQVQV